MIYSVMAFFAPVLLTVAYWVGRVHGFDVAAKAIKKERSE